MLHTAISKLTMNFPSHRIYAEGEGAYVLNIDGIPSGVSWTQTLEQELESALGKDLANNQLCTYLTSLVYEYFNKLREKEKSTAPVQFQTFVPTPLEMNLKGMDQEISVNALTSSDVVTTMADIKKDEVGVEEVQVKDTSTSSRKG